MKITVSDIAEECGVTKQAVYKKLKQFEDMGPEYWSKNDKGELNITEKGYAYLIDSFQPSIEAKKQTDNRQVNMDLVAVLQHENSRLRQEIDRLNEQNDTERQHIRELTDKIMKLAEQLAELNRNNQVLLKTEQERTAELRLEIEQTKVESPKETWLNKIFSK